MKNDLNKFKKVARCWSAVPSDSSREELEGGMIRISRIKKISSQLKSHMMTKANCVA